ncbi:MAG: hypothetical protein K2P74_04570 [Nitrosomonas sp.]|nr:hypothetical protein [Nitrosomonas sp.]
MTFTVDDLNAVEAAIASGELTVISEGRQVTYRSMLDLMRARDLIRLELQQAGTLTKKKRYSFISRGNY